MKRVYAFEEGNASMRDELGGKGANLAEMMSLGLPVPNGFTITTATCMEYLNNGQVLSTEVKEEIKASLEKLQAKTGKAFSSKESLLLVSVRSGAKFSMPGMMDTILNLGLNDENVEILAQLTQDPRFAYDCYRRLLQMFGSVVYAIPMKHFEGYLTDYKADKGYQNDADLTADDLKVIANRFKEVYVEQLNKPFPNEPVDQMLEAVEAVFRSWMNERAIVYRELNDIPENIGTAVNIQEMVYGNSGQNSGTGVAFSRNPSTGENRLFGEYLLNAQGEDVVAGIRTPSPISALADQMPAVYQQFKEVAEQLEKHYKDMQDIEFTIENGKLYFLQTRNGKRTVKAAFKVAVDMVKEGLITKEEAVLKIAPKSIDQLLHPTFDAKALKTAQLITDRGLPASPGAATGKVYFTAEEAKLRVEAGEKVILMRQETSPEDITGMVVSEAIVTTHGGMTSHAAVVARGMGTCCVVGCSDLDINEVNKTVSYQGGVLHEGDLISVDGSSGRLYLGDIDKSYSENNADFDQIMAWAKEYRKMDVRMNAETPADIQVGLNFKASGIGLVRTEHMFFGPERLLEMRRFILSSNEDERSKALETILNYQLDDFKAILKLNHENGTVIRLLDPPLHEFLPKTDQENETVAKQLGISLAVLERRVHELAEFNPMLGHRGCRLAITYPELYTMQVEGIIRSAAQLKAEGIETKPEIMIPLVGTIEEFTILKAQIVERIDAVQAELGCQIAYTIGTMIEIPRACLIADQLAQVADFFSFGTNDLTQMTFGFSRDDAGKFINEYLTEGILPVDPFQTLDVDGVGQLIKLAVEKARAVKPDLKIGVCGELGGDPQSIEFFNNIGLSYVSCSPFRVPIAQLASAQSAIKANK
ncbi:pyruvate, phosphate dikinase [Vaginisenegalia massiliensis]|uniref:pyruvate, phosphate dikinase n=1 Tax=Vaginisenegalia massiliensis TaxID=2058294 RepID=UPI000F51C01C|nr:pyruvate, phosphate dikinase [Vaginisenegalia massiliensis]